MAQLPTIVIAILYFRLANTAYLNWVGTDEMAVEFITNAAFAIRERLGIAAWFCRRGFVFPWI
jgi:hypothetical protein